MKPRKPANLNAITSELNKRRCAVLTLTRLLEAAKLDVIALEHNLRAETTKVLTA